jgi:hypothetical protein
MEYFILTKLVIKKMVTKVTIGHWILYKTDNPCEIKTKNPTDCQLFLEESIKTNIL